MPFYKKTLYAATVFTMAVIFASSCNSDEPTPFLTVSVPADYLDENTWMFISDYAGNTLEVRELHAGKRIAFPKPENFSGNKVIVSIFNISWGLRRIETYLDVDVKNLTLKSNRSAVTANTDDLGK